MTTGEKIRKLRKRNGRSQELARRLGLTRQAASCWETEHGPA